MNFINQCEFYSECKYNHMTRVRNDISCKPQIKHLSILLFKNKQVLFNIICNVAVK